MSVSCVFALLSMCAQGHPLVALALAPLVLGQLWCLRRDRLAGVVLGWRRGVWRLEQGDAVQFLTLTASRTALPWLVFIAMRTQPDGAPRALWLYRDSMSVEDWRRLRQRLTLERVSRVSAPRKPTSL